MCGFFLRKGLCWPPIEPSRHHGIVSTFTVLVKFASAKQTPVNDSRFGIRRPMDVQKIRAANEAIQSLQPVPEDSEC